MRCFDSIPKVVALVLAGLVVGGCAGLPDEADGSSATAPEEFAQQAQDITLSSCTESAILAAAPANARTFINRALNWVHSGAPYSQVPQSAYGGYRTDCSGLVSMAWGLPPPGHTTYSFAGGPWDDHASVRLGSFDDLAIGDATNYPGSPSAGTGHIRIFAGWLDAAHTQYCSIEEYNYGHPAEIRPHTLDRTSYLPIRLAGWTPASAAWGGQFVSQSFPYASAGAIQVHAGATVNVSITMRNIGSSSWNSNTRLATTTPRDRASRFVGPGWLSASRPAAVSGTVAPGATHTFAFSIHAPATLAPGRYDEHFGMVQESTAWFSASDQAGPPDDQLEGIIEVLPAIVPPLAPDAGVADAATHSDALVHDGAGPSDGSSGHDAAIGGDGGAARDGESVTDANDSDVRETGDASARDARGDGSDRATMPAGCSVRKGSVGSRGAGLAALMALVTLAIARRRRSSSRA